jgi:Tol biopolymer transport system component
LTTALVVLGVLAIAWTADGREIVFSSDPNGNFSLRRIPVAGGEPVPVAGTSAFSSGWGDHISDLTISRHGNRLAYTQWFQDANIYRIEAPTSSEQSGPPERLIASTQKANDAHRRC